MPSKEEYIEWMTEHTTMFGMSDADANMVASWRSALDSYSLSELRAASVELLKSAPVYRNEHVSEFFKILGLKRGQQVKAFAAQRDDEYTGVRCSLCRNSGYVIVPHPGCVRDGEFVHGPAGYKATAAVFCSCHVGSKKCQTFDGQRQRPLSLQAYEATISSGWQAMLDEKAEEDKARSGLQKAARLADNARGKLKTATVKP